MNPFFKKLKVLELASVLAGPSVGQFFAELGADVIKVENLHSNGDVTRSWKTSGERTDDRSAYFCAVNWGKRSIALDLTVSRDRDILHSLAKKSDVVIASYKPGDAEKLGVSYGELRSMNPKIIYGEITGYGAHNGRVGYDAVLQAETGFMFMNGEAGSAPVKMPVALIDILAAHQLKEAMLLALLDLFLTGEGKYVSVSLFDSAVASLANQATNFLINGSVPQRRGSAHPNIAPYGDLFYTQGGVPILLAVGNDKQFKSLCHVLSRPDLASDEKFITNAARVAHRPALVQELQAAIQHQDAQPLMTKLIELNIPAGRIRDLGEVFSDPEVTDLILKADNLRGVRTYIGGNTPLFDLLPPPHFGQHTEEILRELDH